jgi:protease-4
MWKKIGITFKSYDRGANANILSTDRLWSDEQRQHVQGWMEDIYGQFKKHVTDIRGDRLKKPIDEIAGGRVYTGRQALELGLVDKIGSFNDAVAFAADQAKLTGEYDVRTVPEAKNFLEKLMEKASDSGNDEERRWIGSSSPSASLVDLAMPYLKGLDPARVAAIRGAMEKLQLLDREGVLLVMPEGFVFN